MLPMTDPRLEAARLLDTDEPVGAHQWPLACYVSEAIENEMATFTAAERRRGYDARLLLAIRRVAMRAATYADEYGLDPLVFRAAVDTRF